MVQMCTVRFEENWLRNIPKNAVLLFLYDLPSAVTSQINFKTVPELQVNNYTTLDF